MDLGETAVEGLVRPIIARMPSEPTACPVCENADWEEVAQQFVLRESDPRFIHGGGMDVTAFFCTRCGFVRLHRSVASNDS